ncbi:hypothetical protein Dda_3695 [Drechslerella dactyloides]|uniref:Uncharacterized protein n=1 Tax=Drechslerella dactyloides TaxID=74499 RepID=A0AAD6J0Q9_DREDA|nr:hypothetical protein Dda_3695 [Drechslerella dactyloides]
MPARFFKKKVFRIRSESPDFGFSAENGDAYKSERSYSSASDSAGSESESAQAGRPSVLEHPVSSMQGPFLESMRCSDVDVENAVNPKGLDLKHHPLVKVFAQIAFGIHLLHKKLAKSETEVVKILQRHVDDINKFLNKATTTIDSAITDIEDRHKSLKAAIDNSAVFEKMLATDLAFRKQISEGNQKVDAVVKTTASALDKNLKDVAEGTRGLAELSKYMTSIKKGWKNTGLVRNYRTMLNNIEVWGRCFESLRKSSAHLEMSVDRLKHVVGQVDKRVRKASKIPPRPPRAKSPAPQPVKEVLKSLKHVKSLPGLPVIPKRTSSLRIRDSALAPLGLRSMFLPDSEVSLLSPPHSPKPPTSPKSPKIPVPSSPKPPPSPKFSTTPRPPPSPKMPPSPRLPLRFRPEKPGHRSSMPPLHPGKSAFLNVEDFDFDDTDPDSAVSVTSLSPRPRRPNQWKPLPPTPRTPPADALLIHSFPRPSSAGSPDKKQKTNGQGDEKGYSPLTIELCLEGCLDDYTSMFQLRPVFGKNGLPSPRLGCSPMSTARPPLALRSATAAI